MCSYRTIAVFLVCSTITLKSRAANLPVAEDSRNATTHAQNRIDTAKFFNYNPLFDQKCVGDSGQIGLCQVKGYCEWAGNIKVGSCFLGMSDCCIPVHKCDDSSKYEGSAFVNKHFPSETMSADDACNFQIIQRSGFCQVRLDFDYFEIGQPRPLDGQCIDDRFEVVGARGDPPVICGRNNGQHMYLEFGKEKEITLSVTTSGEGLRKWKIRATQIACADPQIAPSGCLQYFRNTTGMVKIFNFDGRVFGPHLANMRYGVCVRTEEDRCGIKWQPCSAQRSFSMSGDYRSRQNALSGDRFCQTDYVVIPSGRNTMKDSVGGTKRTVDRFCGTRLNVNSGSTVDHAVYSYIHSPFVLNVWTDDSENSYNAIRMDQPVDGIYEHVPQKQESVESSEKIMNDDTTDSDEEELPEGRSLVTKPQMTGLDFGPGWPAEQHTADSNNHKRQTSPFPPSLSSAPVSYSSQSSSSANRDMYPIMERPHRHHYTTHTTANSPSNKHHVGNRGFCLTWQQISC